MTSGLRLKSNRFACPQAIDSGSVTAVIQLDADFLVSHVWEGVHRDWDALGERQSSTFMGFQVSLTQSVTQRLLVLSRNNQPHQVIPDLLERNSTKRFLDSLNLERP